MSGLFGAVVPLMSRGIPHQLVYASALSSIVSPTRGTSGTQLVAATVLLPTVMLFVSEVKPDLLTVIVQVPVS